MFVRFEKSNKDDVPGIHAITELSYEEKLLLLKMLTKEMAALIFRNRSKRAIETKMKCKYWTALQILGDFSFILVLDKKCTNKIVMFDIYTQTIPPTASLAQLPPWLFLSLFFLRSTIQFLVFLMRTERIY